MESIDFNPQDFVIADTQFDFFNKDQVFDDGENLFEDDSFPCETKSVYVYDKDIPTGFSRIRQWLRPRQFTDKPSFFVDGCDTGDVIQGGLGDCWFLGALSILGCRSDIINYIVIVRPKDATKRGRYVFRFYKEGQWVFVEIDDRLPCDEYGNLVFARCADKNELWVPLLEKAYAKLFGSYQQLTGGHVMNAIVDMTGGVSQITKITPDMANDDALWEQLSFKTNNGSFMLGCCSIGLDQKELEHSGLLSGHAYAVLKTLVVQGHKLIKIRNPWGHGEWKLKWSDEDKVSWTEQMVKEVGAKFGDDGEFWMEYADFCKYWTQLDCVRLFNDPYERERKGLPPRSEMDWSVEIRKGQWQGETAGGLFSSNTPESAKNPQFVLHLKETTEVCISLMQFDHRYDGDDKEEDYPIGFHVLKYEGTSYDPEYPERSDRAAICTADRVVMKSKFEYSREVIAEGTLPSGTYIVVCSTYFPNLTSNFILRVFAKTKKHNLQVTALPPADYIYRTVTVDGQWIKGETAGGCQNSWKWILNRQYKLRVTPGKGEEKIQVALSLSQNKDPKAAFFIGLYVLEAHPNDENAPVHDLKKAFDTKQFTSLREVQNSIEFTSNKTYIVIPATFNPGEEATFSLTAKWRRDIYPQSHVEITPIGENYGYKFLKIKSKWEGRTAGGCPNNRDTWMNNPKFQLVVNKAGAVDVLLMQEDAPADQLAGVGFHIFSDNKTVVAATDTWHFTKLATKSNVQLQPGKYTIMPSTFYKDQEKKFSIAVSAKDYVIATFEKQD